jgi:hypothetical protein
MSTVQVSVVRRHRPAVRIIAGAGAVLFGVLGLWAFAAPRSFFDAVATYPPYNEHLLHDVGAFQLGIAVALLLAVLRSDALLAALGGAAGGAAAHAVAHWIDLELGGRASDPWVLTLLAAVFVIAAAWRWKEVGG